MFHAFGHPVATCWVLLAQILPLLNLSQQHPTCHNTLQYGGQTIATCCAQQCCDMLHWHVAIIWLGLLTSKAPANNRNMSSQHCWAQHVARVFGHRVALSCKMLGVVGPSFKMVKCEPTTPKMSQHIASRSPSACNMFHPTMLRSDALLTCWDHLAGV